ncbi:MAG: hypothetical protein ACRD0K_24805 [Egibacteraceae bacterium]
MQLWLGDPLKELTVGLAAVVAALCLLRWRVASDAQALLIGLAMALYGARCGPPTSSSRPRCSPQAGWS